jgi:hypothetical protein
LFAVALVGLGGLLLHGHGGHPFGLTMSTKLVQQPAPGDLFEQ